MKNNWQTKTLGEVCEIYQPKTISAKEMTADGKYKVFGANGPIGWYHSFNHEDPQLLITCRGATCGYVNMSEPRSWITGNAMVVRPRNSSPSLRYLEYLFRGGIDLSKAITGTAQPQITRTNLSPIVISFPESLPEQRRIVAILDDVFERVAKAKANAEKNLANAREVFESYLQKVFAEPGKGWEEKRLGDVCSTGAGGTPLKSHKEYYDGGTIPWLMSGEVSQGEIFKAQKFITDAGLKNSSARMFPSNTVLVAMYGATAGQVGILRFPASTNQAVCGILPNETLLTEFIFYYFLSVQKDLIGLAVGNAQPNISQEKIKNQLIPILPLPEQRTIVANLDALSSETKQLEAIYRQKLSSLEELKKSVLRSAFRGEL